MKILSGFSFLATRLSQLAQPLLLQAKTKIAKLVTSFLINFIISNISL